MDYGITIGKKFKAKSQFSVTSVFATSSALFTCKHTQTASTYYNISMLLTGLNICST